MDVMLAEFGLVVVAVVGAVATSTFHFYLSWADIFLVELDEQDLKPARKARDAQVKPSDFRDSS